MALVRVEIVFIDFFIDFVEIGKKSKSKKNRERFRRNRTISISISGRFQLKVENLAEIVRNRAEIDQKSLKSY